MFFPAFSYKKCPDRVVDAVGEDFLRLNGWCFYFAVDKRETRDGARSICKSYGGRLATPKTIAVNYFLTTELKSIGSKHSSNFREAWIGLHDEDKEGTFVWDDGEPLKYDLFNNAAGFYFPGEEDCVALNPLSGLWDDFRCNSDFMFLSSKKPFICQFDAEETKTTARQVKKLKQQVDEDVEEKNDLEVEG